MVLPARQSSNKALPRFVCPLSCWDVQMLSIALKEAEVNVHQEKVAQPGQSTPAGKQLLSVRQKKSAF